MSSDCAQSVFDVVVFFVPKAFVCIVLLGFVVVLAQLFQWISFTEQL